MLCCGLLLCTPFWLNFHIFFGTSYVWVPIKITFSVTGHFCGFFLNLLFYKLLFFYEASSCKGQDLCNNVSCEHREEARIGTGSHSKLYSLFLQSITCS